MIISGITFCDEPIIEVSTPEEYNQRLGWTFGLTEEQITEKFLDRIEIDMAVQNKEMKDNWRIMAGMRIGFKYFKIRGQEDKI